MKTRENCPETLDNTVIYMVDSLYLLNLLGLEAYMSRCGLITQTCGASRCKYHGAYSALVE